MTLPDIFANGPMTASLNAGDNTYGAGANGISILEDVLTTPNGITMNSVGISYDSGTTITTTSWDDITTRVAALSAIAPNGLNATLLAVNNTISIQNADTSPTRVINTSAEDGTGGTHFGIAWVGNTLPFVMETLDATPLQVKDTQLKLTSSTTGGSANPILTLTNTNADSSSVALEVFKDKGVAPTNGDVLFQQSVYGEDSFLNKKEYTRITHTIRDFTGGAEDGSIEMGCYVNGAFSNFLQINGNQNEVNCLKTLDMGGHTIRTTTGDMSIQTTSSSGNGDLTITAKRDLQLLSAGSEIIISTAASTGSGDIDIIGKSGSITTIQATLIDLNAMGANINLNAGIQTIAMVGSALTFNTINIIPRNLYSTFSFSVFGSPTGTILNFGALVDMVANTTWKVDVGFYTGDGINNRSVITYVVKDTLNTYVEQNSVFGYTQGGLQTPITYDPVGTPMGKYCSFTDTFLVNPIAVGACNFVLTGGTSDGSTWSGTCRVSIVLTRLS
jgi:hypothetical protein